jgi:3-oxoacyl-[acyl-carrier-protein] synthase-1
MPLYVESAGVFTSVGLNVLQTMGSLRTRYSRFQELPFAPRGGDPIVGAPTPLLLGFADGRTRMLAMAGHALAECAQGLPADPPLPMLLCAPEPTELPLDVRPFVAEVAREAKVPVDHAASEAIHGGHAAIAPALARAEQILVSTRLPAVYVAGVDTMLDATRLDALLAARRILDAETREGMIPGEAAVVLRVALHPTQSPWARITGVGVGDEAQARPTGKRSLGVGLVQAMRGALKAANADMAGFSVLITGATGDRYDDLELGLAVARAKPITGKPFDKTTVAYSVGDVGAAMGPLSLAWAAFQMRAGARDKGALYAAASDGRLRGAVFVADAARG